MPSEQSYSEFWIVVLVAILGVLAIGWITLLQIHRNDRNDSNHGNGAQGKNSAENKLPVSSLERSVSSTDQSIPVDLQSEELNIDIPEVPRIVTRTAETNAVGRLVDKYEPGKSSVTDAQTLQILTRIQNRERLRDIAFATRLDQFVVAERFIQVYFDYWGTDLKDESKAFRNGMRYTQDENAVLESVYLNRTPLDQAAASLGRSILGVGMKIADSAAQGNIPDILIDEWFERTQP